MNFRNDTAHARWRGIVLWLGDVVAALVAMLLADALRRVLPFGALPDRYYVTVQVLLLVALIWSAVFYFLGAYERRNRDDLKTEARTLWLSATFALFTLAAALYFFKIEDFSRVLFLYFYVLDIALTLLWRMLAHGMRARRALFAAEARRVLIVGADAAGRELAAQIQTWDGYVLAGFIADAETDASALPAPVLGNFSEAMRVVARYQVDEVFLSHAARGRAELAELILALRDSRVRVRLMPDLLELITVHTGIETLRGLPVITLREPAITGINSVLKRALDVTGAALGIVLTSPLMLLLAVWVKLDSPGPVLFLQERSGQYGKPFRIYKFRSMVADAEQKLLEMVDFETLQEPQYKMRHDPRVTRAGAWMRRTSLDELPQLFNVLFGAMSLVGPRPEDVRLVARYSPFQRQRLLVKPGLTGAMQIGGRADLSFEERVTMELEYIENYSIWRDLMILVKTVPAVLSGRGAY